jgi:hypothetical protein
MARTLQQYSRIYVGGYDLSGYTRQLGDAKWSFESETEVALTEAVKGVQGGFGQAEISPPNITAFLDTVAGGIHEIFNGAAGTMKIVTVAIGEMAIPAAGNLIFTGSFPLNNYNKVDGKHAVSVVLEFSKTQISGAELAYPVPWGVLLHASGAETAVNGGTCSHDNTVATTAGGFGVLQVLAGNGTATFTIEHSATNTDGAFDSTGAIITFAGTAAATPFAEIKKTATKTTTIERYTRWQVALGTATTVTFIMGLVRGR